MTDEKATNAKNKNMWVIVENDFAILRSIQLYKRIPRPTVNVWYKSVLEKNLVFLTDYYFLNPYLIFYILIKVKVHWLKGA